MKLERQDWWDIGYATVLCLLPVLSWATTYDGGHWWWAAGVLGVAAGILLTAGTIATGGGPGRLLLGTLAAYLVLCGPLAHGGVGGGMVIDGFRGTLEGWPMLVAAHPWVDAPGAGVLPVLQMTLLASVAVTVLAMGSRSPAAPVLPAAALLAGAVFTARTEPAVGLVQALVFGVLAVAWVRQRSRLIEGAPTTRDSLVGHTTALVPAVAVLAVGATLAAFAGAAVDLGNRTVLRGVVPAYDATAVVTPLDRFSRYRGPTGNLHDRPLLAVSGAEEGTRVRFVTLDSYDGDRWIPANDADPTRTDDRFLRIASRIDNPAVGEPVQVEITPQQAWRDPWVATVGAIDSLDFGADAPEDARRHLRYNLATRTAVMTEGHELGTEASYTMTARVHDPEFTATTATAEHHDEDLRDRAAFLDPAVQAWAAGATSPAEAVLLVAESLQQAGHYASGGRGFDGSHGRERLGAGFVLSNPTIGNEAHYAAAMALMANRIGVPARVVVGAPVPAGGVVRGEHVTAWIELLAADGSWHVLDAESFTSSQRARGQGLDTPGGGDGPEERLFVEQTPESEKPPKEEPVQPPDPAEGEEPEDADDPDQSDARSDSDRDLSGWLWSLLGVAGLAVVVGAVPAVKWLRRRRRLTRGPAADRYVGAWAELLDQASDLGHRVPTGLTRPAEAGHLGHLGQQRLPALADRVDREVFGAVEPDPAAAEEFWNLVNAELGELRSQASRPRRIWAIFNPKSLF